LRFNPRAREGRDRIEIGTSHFINCFNPRAREGRDCATVKRSSVNANMPYFANPAQTLTPDSWRLYLIVKER
jgi:hypothetical protein